MKNPFWNAEQRRVRALWRLLLQGLLFLVLATILSGLALLAGLSIAITSGRAMPSPADPGFAIKLTELAIGDPFVGVLFMLASFVSIFVSVWAAGKVLDRRPLADFGFHFSRRWWADLGFGLGLGAVGGGWGSGYGVAFTSSQAFSSRVERSACSGRVLL